MADRDGLTRLVARLTMLRQSTAVQAGGIALGTALLIAALLVVARQRDSVFAALSSVDRDEIGWLVLMAVLITAHISASATTFSILTVKYGRVPWRDMQLMIASAALLNYLPLRPGLVGRIAYQKAAYGLSAKDSVRIVAESLVLSGLAAAWIAMSAVVAWATPAPFPIVASLAPAVAVFGLRTAARRWCLAGLVRWVEILLWAARYLLAFRVLGIDLSFNAAQVVGCSSLFANLVPFVSNGLGLREWTVGLLAPALSSDAAAITLELSMTAELINRAMELVVVAIVGGLAMSWLVGRRRPVVTKDGAARAEPMNEQGDPSS